MMRWIVVALSMAFAFAPPFALLEASAQSQSRSSFSNPAEYDAYVAALNTQDPAKRATAMEIFIAWYPASVLRNEALEHAMAAWSAAREPAKADVIAGKLLQIDANNIQALANRVYAARTRVAQGDKAATAPMVETAERGLLALAKWRKPPSLDDATFVRSRQQMSVVFNGALGFAALQAKDYDKARSYYRESVAAEPDNLQDVYHLAVSQLEGTPLDALGFWFAARAIALARIAKNDAAANDIDRYVRSRYRLYRGSEQGWDELLARVVAGERAPPGGFVKSIPRVLTPAELALQLMEENDPGSLSVSDWVLILHHRDTTPANRMAAEKLWRTIVDKQRGGGQQGAGTRIKLAVKVISATPDALEAAITDEAQAGNVADLHIVMAQPLAPLPAAGSRIAIIGTLSEYRPQPFLFTMTGAELAPESMPVAGGACADPRPQMCTRDYRPACGRRRDGTRQTYDNACSACSDAQVVTQSAGACP
jgi:tetratricopeptide (TPR) repeat protein